MLTSTSYISKRSSGIQARSIEAVLALRGEDATSLEVKAKDFINPAKLYATYDEVLRGAQHILVEKLSSVSDLRQQVRDEYYNHGKLRSQKTAEFKPHSKYEMYAEFSEGIK